MNNYSDLSEGLYADIETSKGNIKTTRETRRNNKISKLEKQWKKGEKKRTINQGKRKKTNKGNK